MTAGMGTSQVGALTAAANKPKVGPESGFDAKTGELRIGETLYWSRKYTRALRKANTGIDDPELGARLIEMRAQLNTEGAKVTADDLRAFTDANNDALDTAYKRVVLLFADSQGRAPDLDLVMDELGDADVQDAVEYATANPTDRKTGATSS